MFYFLSYFELKNVRFILDKENRIELFVYANDQTYLEWTKAQLQNNTNIDRKLQELSNQT